MANKAIIIVLLMVVTVLFMALMGAQHFIGETHATLITAFGVLLIVGGIVKTLLSF